jgi:hypothetical protein
MHTAVSISMEGLCLLIDQATHMTLLLPVGLMSCHVSTVGLANCMALGFSSYLHGTDVHPTARQDPLRSSANMTLLHLVRSFQALAYCNTVQGGQQAVNSKGGRS